MKLSETRPKETIEPVKREKLMPVTSAPRRESSEAKQVQHNG